MSAMTDMQLHRYNAATIDQVRNYLKDWATQISTPEHEVKSYFIEVSFQQVADLQLKYFLNKIPTSFKLSQEQVEALKKSAKNLLHADPEYQHLLKDLAMP